MSNRALEWCEFSTLIKLHINGYTIPQYGDFPDDQVTEWSVEDLEVQLKKYVGRLGKNARGEIEAERDLFKIAHYACLIHAKRYGNNVTNKERLKCES